jgi:hypothetical protein
MRCDEKIKKSINAKGAKVREVTQRKTRAGPIKGLVLDNQRLCAVMRKPAEITRQNSMNAKDAKVHKGKPGFIKGPELDN